MGVHAIRPNVQLSLSFSLLICLPEHWPASHSLPLEPIIMQLFANLALALSLALSFISSSLAHAHQGSRHHHVHRQADLARRDAGSRFTYYAVGLGACGAVSQPTDFVRSFRSWVRRAYSPSTVLRLSRSTRR